MFKKLLIVFSILLLCLSCNKGEKDKVYLLTNEESIIAFSEEKHNIITLYFSPDAVKKVMRSENLTSQEVFKALYGVDQLSVVNISANDIKHIERLFNSLTHINNGENGLKAFTLLEKGLRKTEFVDTIKALVSDKKGDSFLSLLDKDKNIIVLSGDDFISHAAPWEEKVSFFKAWCTEIGVYSI